jgi:hypothetical protein
MRHTCEPFDCGRVLLLDLVERVRQPTDAVVGRCHHGHVRKLDAIP